MHFKRMYLMYKTYINIMHLIDKIINFSIFIFYNTGFYKATYNNGTAYWTDKKGLSV